LNIKKLHPDFKLNGFTFTEKTLKDAAYSFIKEGEPYEKAIGAFLFDWLDDKFSIQVQTSGSTGVRKSIWLQKEQMTNSAITTGHFFELHPAATSLLCLSADYIAGKMMLVRAMVLGLHLDCVAPNSEPLKGNAKKYSFCAMVPLQVENSLKSLANIEKLIIGGAPVSYSLKQKLKSVDCSVYETYGMTETITHVAVKRIDSALSSPSSLKRLKDAALDRFIALSNVIFSTDNRACLVISAPKISNNPVITNDIVKLISETEFEWLGRFDNVINSGGVKLHPEIIEEKLTSVISHRFFVAGLPDESLGQKLVLIIESKADEKNYSNIETFSAILDKYEMPKAIFFLTKFALTKNGKLSRRETILLIE